MFYQLTYLRIEDIIGTIGLAVLHFKKRFGFVVRDISHVEVKLLTISAGPLATDLLSTIHYISKIPPKKLFR